MAAEGFDAAPAAAAGAPPEYREPPEDGAGWDDPHEGAKAENAAAAMHSILSTQTLPIKSYLDATVVPVLIEALMALAKARPDNPVDWLAMYMLQNDPARRRE